MGEKKILLINDVAELKGGAEEVIRRERKYLTDRGYHVRSLGLDKAETEDPFTDFVAREPSFRSLRVLGKVAFSPRMYRRIRSIVVSYDPDLVHIHKSEKYPSTVALATRGYPSIKTHHDYSTVCPTSWAVRQDDLTACECGIGLKCVRSGCRSLPVLLGYHVPIHLVQQRIERRIINEHLAPSPTLAQYLNSFGYDARHIPNPQATEPAGDDEGYFLFVGRLCAEKGVTVLLEAARTLVERGVVFDLKIAGSGPAEEWAMSYIDEHCDGQVDLLGYISEERKYQLYAGARAIIVPSVWMENYPTVVLEGLAHAKPIIGSNRGGIKDMVQDGTTGHLYPPTDHEALADRMEASVKNPANASEMGARGQDWVRQFSSFELFGKQLEGVIESLTSRNGSL